jgi:hypothetical protein
METNIYIYIYIGFWTLKMKCTQYGLHAWTSVLQDYKGNFYISKSDGTCMEHELHLGSEGGGPTWAQP